MWNFLLSLAPANKWHTHNYILLSEMPTTETFNLISNAHGTFPFCWWKSTVVTRTQPAGAAHMRTWNSGGSLPVVNPWEKEGRGMLKRSKAKLRVNQVLRNFSLWPILHLCQRERCLSTAVEMIHLACLQNNNWLLHFKRLQLHRYQNARSMVKRFKPGTHK